MKIVVLAGGTSTERDVSIVSGTGICQALRQKGHQAILVDVFCGLETVNWEDPFPAEYDVEKAAEYIKSFNPQMKELKKARRDFFGPNVIRMCQMADIVFMALHGENGENGKLQAAFDLFGIKYTGSDYLSSAIAMNKDMAKQLFAYGDIPAPKGIGMTKETREDDVTKLGLTLPCVVKPCCGGSSIGVTIVRDAAEFKAALDEAFKWEDHLIIEEYVKGREFSVGVLEGKALPVIEIAPIQGFYDYKNKYKAGSAVETCPADLPEEISAKMRRYAERVAEVIGLDTYSRSDFLLDENNQIYCLEANTLPGMTPTSLLPQEAAVIGINFNELCEKLIEISLRKYEG